MLAFIFHRHSCKFYYFPFLKKVITYLRKYIIHKSKWNLHLLTSTRDATNAGFGRTEVMVVPFPFFISEKKESNRYQKRKITASWPLPKSRGLQAHCWCTLERKLQKENFVFTISCSMNIRSFAIQWFQFGFWVLSNN